MLDVTRKGAVLRPPKTGVSGVGQFNRYRPTPDFQSNHPTPPLSGPRAVCLSAAGADRLKTLLTGGQNDVDQAVLLGLVGGHDLVTVDVLADLLDRLAGVARDHLLQLGTHPEDLAGLDLDVRALAVAALGG